MLVFDDLTAACLQAAFLILYALHFLCLSSAKLMVPFTHTFTYTFTHLNAHPIPHPTQPHLITSLPPQVLDGLTQFAQERVSRATQQRSSFTILR